MRWKATAAAGAATAVATARGSVSQTPSVPPAPAPAPTPSAADCHPSNSPCLPNLPGNAPDCGNLRSNQKPGQAHGPDRYQLDRDRDGIGCEAG